VAREFADHGAPYARACSGHHNHFRFLRVHPAPNEGIAFSAATLPILFRGILGMTASIR
jgi:hypothetical protein